MILNVDAEKDDNIPHHARGVAFMSGGGSISARGSISKSGEGANVKCGGGGFALGLVGNGHGHWTMKGFEGAIKTMLQ